MKKNNNQMVADRLNNMNLSEQAQDILAETDINILAELFGGCETADDVEELVSEIIKEESE